MKFCKILASVCCGVLCVVAAVQAEVKELRIGRQLGLGYLQLYVMQEQRLVEKYAREDGLGELTVSYQAIGSPVTLNDGILSGNLDFVSAAPPPFLNLWDRTKGNLNVRALAALNMQRMRLNTNQARIQTVRDFTVNDRIAVPGLKTSIHAVLLGMAAERFLGPDKRAFFETLQVPFAHPDAMIALLSGKDIVTAHFATIPFQTMELQNPGIHTVITSYDLTDGPSTFSMIWGAGRFHDENPKTTRATLRAREEATKFINENRAEAARIFIKLDNSKMGQSDVEAILADPDVVYSLAPRGVMLFAEYMTRVGLMKNKPASWKDLMFPEAQNLPGS